MNTVGTDEKLIEVLNDLVKINNDRVSGYEKAADESKDLDVDLRTIFRQMADDSRSYNADLIERIQDLGGQTEGGTTAMGKLYRAWMDVKVTFSGNDRKAILSACEFGEDAAQRAYTDALGTDADMDTETRQLIASQKADLKRSHDLIKTYRDAGRE